MSPDQMPTAGVELRRRSASPRRPSTDALGGDTRSSWLTPRQKRSEPAVPAAPKRSSRWPGADLRERPIRVQLVVLALVILLPSFVLCGLYVRSQWNLALESAYGRARAAAQGVATDLDGTFRDYEVVLARIADRPQIRALDRNACDPIIGEYAAVHREISAISVRDANGDLVCGSNPTIPQVAPESLRQMQREGMQSGRLLISDGTTDNNGRWIVRLIQPIRDSSQKVVGTIAAPLDLVAYSRQLLADVGGGTSVMLIDRGHRIIMHTAQLDASVGQRLGEDGVRLIDDRPEGRYRLEDPSGAMRIGAWMRVPRPGFTVALDVPEREAVGTFRAALLNSAIVFVLVFGAIVALVWWIGDGFRKPLRALTRTARAVSANDELARAAERGAPEVRHFAQQFNRMLDAINRHEVELESAMKGTLTAVAKMVEKRDPYTAGHQRRVGLIASEIARELGWKEARCAGLELVGLVHDIGKIAIPVELLVKSTPLSAEEFDTLRSHPQVGHDVLAGIPFWFPVADIILQHHERLDGSGYPRGLKGDEIMPEARILAVADVLESMAAARPYRAALGAEAALAELYRGRGVLYDAQAVDAIHRLLGEGRYELPR